jgi:hypothetical protein
MHMHARRWDFLRDEEPTMGVKDKNIEINEGY